jgi:glyoxylase-like metal-dependent hydrolase (beta-lactamase superfamily II)
VVDPREDDLDAYVKFATETGMRIAHVIDTHVHADHRSGGRALAARTGAAYGLHRSADVAFPFDPLDDGQVIALGNTVIEIRHTPGHTRESISLVVRDLRRGPEPWFACTGDTLFVGAVGRPDLPGHERECAATLRRHIHDKLLVLPDDVEVYPAHFAGSACGAGMSGKPSSTIASEKRWNTVLALSETAFVEQVGAAVPPKPEGMAEILRWNQGRA